MKAHYYPGVLAVIEAADTHSISAERKKELEVLIQYVSDKIVNNQQVSLNFICTHNSRRSQLAQVWADVMAHYKDVPIRSYSGGVEVTACNERTITALQKSGFEIEAGEGENPVYKVSYGESKNVRLFSKLFDDSENDAEQFAAVMTCSHADENCPFIPGTEQRISLRYEDPKVYDGTDQEAKMYMERSNQIATELLYVFKQVKSNRNG